MRRREHRPPAGPLVLGRATRFHLKGPICSPQELWILGGIDSAFATFVCFCRAFLFWRRRAAPIGNSPAKPGRLRNPRQYRLLSAMLSGNRARHAPLSLLPLYFSLSFDPLQILNYLLQILNYLLQILNYPLQILNYPLRNQPPRCCRPLRVMHSSTAAYTARNSTSSTGPPLN